MEAQPLYKIMLIDDDSFLLNMYALKFSKSGFEPATFPSAEQALKKLKEGYVPDIILLDKIMPGMDGLDFLAQIRKDHLADKATVIMLTNESDSLIIEKAKQFNINGYIIKATTIPSEVISQVLEINKSKTILSKP